MRCGVEGVSEKNRSFLHQIQPINEVWVKSWRVIWCQFRIRQSVLVGLGVLALVAGSKVLTTLF
jgi:hypothetical protein